MTSSSSALHQNYPGNLSSELQGSPQAQQKSALQKNLEPRLDQTETIETQQLIRTFNTALITTQSKNTNAERLSEELQNLIQSPAYQQILEAIHRLAQQQGTGELQAAEDIIRTFRHTDRIWSDYVFNQGVAQTLRTKSSE